MDQRLLKEILEKAKSTKILDLQSKKLDRNNITAIAEAIPQIEGLIALDLSEIPISPEDVNQLVESIQKCKDLLYLGFSFCNLGNQSAANIINGVKHHPKLISLDLSCNKFELEFSNNGSDNGLRLRSVVGDSVADLLRTNTNLLALNLSTNNLRMEGQIIRKAMESNSSILSLSVMFAQMSRDAENAINEKAEENRVAFEENAIKQSRFDFVPTIPIELVEYLNQLNPKLFEEGLLELYQDPIVFIGRLQASRSISKERSIELVPEQRTPQKPPNETENHTLNTLISFSMRKKPVELVQEEQILVETLGVNKFNFE